MKAKKYDFSKFTLTELFLVMADWNRTYTGTILRKNTEHGILCHGTVVIDEGKVVSVASSDELLAQNLDDICKMKLDYGLHKKAGESTTIMESESFLN